MTAVPSPEIYEKLATFYLGRGYDLSGGKLTDDLLLYDAKDLTTHALCVGMTGSGKTGLCLSLLEEAALDGVPVICVDPKGDLANLALSFPDLKPSDFKPWLEPSAASRKGLTVDQLADKTAKTWADGLASWGQSPGRVRAFRDAAEVSIYTPGSSTGLPLTVLKSFDAPPPDQRGGESMQQRVVAATSGLMTLLDIDADPLLSPEPILVSSILAHCWQQGQNVAIADLIGLIQSPPIKKLGVLDLDTFMPPSDRAKLAMRLNNLLASPAFASWLVGEPLSIDRLLYTPAGKPRISILSIAHLPQSQRMFFVTILLGELVAWMRTQRGTGSLRAIFYMDEVAGYFPPVANPPSKPPMLTLLKQARAFGLGVTLATQNPVDLDYKGLSNIGTWFLGRLQTERDKARVLEGLEGAAQQTGQKFDRAAMERTLASLGNRVFLMNNVHEDGPVTFQTRWAMSFLAGPLASPQIAELMAEQKRQVAEVQPPTQPATVAEPAGPVSSPTPRPVLPTGIEEKFLLLPARVRRPRPGYTHVYRPAVACTASLHYTRRGTDLDRWEDVARMIRITGANSPADGWTESEPVDADADFSDDPEAGYEFTELPAAWCSAREIGKLDTKLKSYLYRHRPLTIYRCEAADNEIAPPGSNESAARRHFEQPIREARDTATEDLRNKYAAKLDRIDDQIRTARDRVDREESQYEEAKMSSWMTIGSSVIGAFLGRKVASRTNVSRIGTAARSASRASAQKSDVRRAEESLEQLRIDREELEDELKRDLAELSEQFDPRTIPLETLTVRPLKGDLKVSDPFILWTPWAVDGDGIAVPVG